MTMKMRKTPLLLITAFIFSLASPALSARDVNITKEMPLAEFTHNGKKFVIERIQDQGNVLTGGFTRTSRMCPPFCVQPMVPVAGISPVGELEIIEFMKTHVQNGTGVLVDARTPDWHRKGTIPGSTNIPFTHFEHGVDHPKLHEAFKKLGVTPKYKHGGVWDSLLGAVGLAEANEYPWDFSNAKEVIMWCNGMWCGQSPHAIKAMLRHGYPAEKIHYYRGGMQSWQILGLSVVVP